MDKTQATTDSQPDSQAEMPGKIWIPIVILWAVIELLVFTGETLWVREFLVPMTKLFGGFIPAMVAVIAVWAIGSELVKLARKKPEASGGGDNCGQQP